MKGILDAPIANLFMIPKLKCIFCTVECDRCIMPEHDIMFYSPANSTHQSLLSLEGYAESKIKKARKKFGLLSVEIEVGPFGEYKCTQGPYADSSIFSHKKTLAQVGGYMNISFAPSIAPGAQPSFESTR